jgi:(S)-2-hydroxy-acid oxidase
MSAPVGPVEDQYPTITGNAGNPVNVAEYERYAKSTLSKNAHGYYASGSNDMITLRENRSAYSRLRIIPRALVDVSRINMKATILGDPVDSPILIAPTAMQCMAHPDGELATIRASKRLNTLMTLSSWSTKSLEDVSNESPTCLKWFQLYVYKDRKVCEDLVKRAEKAGYKAFAVTVDTPILGRREADIKNQFALPQHLTMANFNQLGGAHADGTKISGSTGSGIASYASSLIDRTLTWDDIKWLRTITKCKIVVKGIMSVDDAIKAVENGVDAIWVSNHGARQLDTAPATIEVLPDISRAIAGRCEIYLDGGITRGTDVFKAIALGAKAVFVGRPVLWGLAHSGENGVFNIMTLLNEELNLAMMLAGVTDISFIKPSFIRTALSFQSRL